MNLNILHVNSFVEGIFRLLKTKKNLFFISQQKNKSVLLFKAHRN